MSAKESDAKESPELPGCEPGPLAVRVTQVPWTYYLGPSIAHLVAGWSWDSVEAPLFAEDLVNGPVVRERVWHLAMWGDQPVGFLSTQHDGQSLLLNGLVIAPERRRRGVASLLVRMALSTPQHPKLVEAFVRDVNLAGQCFYRSLGFTGRKCRRAPLIRFTR